MRARTAALALVAATLLAGCAGTVNGSGSQASEVATNGGSSAVPGTPNTGSSSSVGSPSPDFPSGSASSSSLPSITSTPSASDAACPTPYYAPAVLRFTCITSGMTARTSDPVWPLLEIKQVEASGWALQEGAARYTGPSGTLESDVFHVRSEMLDSLAYLASPKVATLRIQTGKFGARRAVIISSQITLNPAAAAERKTKVKVERLWILAVQSSPGVVSLWHTSLPDLVKYLWKKVPAEIANVKVAS